MQNLNFYIATEQHARMLLPCANSSTNIYITNNSPRRTAIDVVLKKFNNIGFTIKNQSDIFTDILNQNTKNIFVLPLHVSKTKYHQAFYSCKNFKDYLNTNLSNISNTVIILNELIAYPVDKYCPHAHAVFARSQIEFDILKSQIDNSTKTYLIGDTAADSNQVLVPKNSTEKDLLLLTSLDPSRYTAAYPVIDRIVEDLKEYIKNNKVQSLQLKEHPGACSSDYIKTIEILCNKNKIKYTHLPKNIDISQISNFNTAIVHSSFSSFLQLRKINIRCYYYWSVDERNWDDFLFLKSKMPNTSLAELQPEEFNKWVINTFLLDGKTKERFEDACKNIYSLRYPS